MDISTAWPKSYIHTWIYPWISISTASLGFYRQLEKNVWKQFQLQQYAAKRVSLMFEQHRSCGTVCHLICGNLDCHIWTI